MKRILIFNVNWLGDTLFSTPFIKAVRKRFPESYIVCLAPPRCKEILDDNPYLDGLIIYDEKGYHRSIFGKLRLIRELRREHFDGTFILHRSFTRALIAYLSGIRERIGYKTKRRSILLTRAIEEPSSPLHKVDYFLNIAALCGMETGGKGYDFFVRGAERKRVEDFLEKMGVHEDDLLVVLNPGGNWLPKRWPAERFSEIADRLADELGAKVVITGAPKDLGLARKIIALSGTDPVNAAGKTTIKELGALMERAGLVISSDSGPMHLAVGVKSKVIALFGPTSELLTGPYGPGEYTVIRKDVDCNIPCYNHACIDYRCMKIITVDEVFRRAKEMLLEKSIKE